MTLLYRSTSTVSLITRRLKSEAMSAYPLFRPFSFSPSSLLPSFPLSYCVRVYQSSTPPTNIFLPLLRIYLLPRPSPNTDSKSKSDSKTTTPLLIPPALSLIATHSTKLEPLEVISLLPPLLTMQDVHSFFLRTLREGKAKRNDGRVLREIEKTRGEELDWRLLRLQERRVRIGDTRM